MKRSKFPVPINNEKMRVKKEVYVEFIIDNLKSGIVDYKENIRLFQTKFDTSRQTFINYWKIANAQYAGLIQCEKSEKNKIFLEKKINESEKGYLKREQKIKILSEIASGEITLGTGEKIISPNFKERILAIQELNRMDGDHSPTRIETNIPISGFRLLDGDELLKMKKNDKD